MTFNPQKYGASLADALPTVIEDKIEHDPTLEIVNDLMSKSELLPEEGQLLNLLVELVEVYGKRRCFARGAFAAYFSNLTNPACSK